MTVIDPLIHMCHCGHVRDTHFDPRAPKTGACLGMRCECSHYRDATELDPESIPVRLAHRVECRCYDCKRYLDWVAAKALALSGW